MQGFIDSFQFIFAKYKLEIIFISIALSFTIISGFLFLINNSSPPAEIPELTEAASLSGSDQLIQVDLAGAVEKAEVYQVSSGARLKDILILAGGLAQDADRPYFARNFNLAKVINDQEKIYIPSLSETQSGDFNPVQESINSQIDNLPGQINVNSASFDELDTLPGIGKVTAQKIIQTRPYSSVEELLSKKAVGKSVYEKIKNLVTVGP